MDTILREVEKNIITIDKEIKDCDQNNLFDFIYSHFATFFFDWQEANKFVKYLIDNKSNTTIKNLLDNFKDVLKEFKKEN